MKSSPRNSHQRSDIRGIIITSHRAGYCKENLGQLRSNHVTVSRIVTIAACDLLRSMDKGWNGDWWRYCIYGGPSYSLPAVMEGVREKGG